MNFLIIGAGAWGTGIAVHLKRSGHSVTLTCENTAEKERILRDGENKLRMPGIKTDGLNFVTADEIPGGIEAVIVALPSHVYEVGVKNILQKAPALATGAKWVSLAKSIVLTTHKTPSETLEDILPKGTPVFCLSGPQHAGSVAAGLPSAAVLSGHGDCEALQEAINSPLMRVYGGHDRRGAELGGALKNSYAVAAGICDGLGLGDNAKAGLLTRSLAEMARLGVALGGKQETFFGLTGVGDLMATSYGVWSRNRQLGERVARGEDGKTLVDGGLTAEGYRASKGLLDLAQQKKIDAPILAQVAAVLHEGKSPKAALLELMSRPLKKE